MRRRWGAVGHVAVTCGTVELGQVNVPPMREIDMVGDAGDALPPNVFGHGGSVPNGDCGSVFHRRRGMAVQAGIHIRDRGIRARFDVAMANHARHLLVFGMVERKRLTDGQLRKPNHPDGQRGSGDKQRPNDPAQQIPDGAHRLECLLLACRPNWTGSAGGAGRFTCGRLAGKGEPPLDPQPVTNRRVQVITNSRCMRRYFLSYFSRISLTLSSAAFFSSGDAFASVSSYSVFLRTTLS